MSDRGNFVLAHFAAQCIAVDAQEFCRARLIAVGAFQRALDEFLLEFDDSFFEQYPALDHLPHQRFELFLHDGTLHDDASEDSLRGPVIARCVVGCTFINRVGGR
jgi:hypothetical protein